MRIFDFMGLRDSGYSTETNNSGTGQSYAIEFSQARASAADEYEWLANQAADDAMRFGLQGYSVTSEVCAELADAYAKLAYVARWTDMMKRSA